MSGGPELAIAIKGRGGTMPLLKIFRVDRRLRCSAVISMTVHLTFDAY